MNEVKFSQYVDTGKYVTSIGLGDFIKCEFVCSTQTQPPSVLLYPLLDVNASTCPVVYVNHRPAFGLSQRELIDTIRTLGMRTDSREWAISRPHFLSLLQDCGGCAPCSLCY